MAKILKDGNFKNVELIFLSACHTARHIRATRTFEEYEAIDNVMLSRGARSLVSTLWAVDDIATVIFSARFYVDLNRGISPAMAARAAATFIRHGRTSDNRGDTAATALICLALPGGSQSWERVKDKYKHPYYWAPFRCFGEAWRPVIIPTGK